MDLARGTITHYIKNEIHYECRFDDCNQRGHRVGSWCEEGSFGLGMFAPDKLKLRVRICRIYLLLTLQPLRFLKGNSQPMSPCP